MEKRMVIIVSSSTRNEAEIIKGTLTANGIESIITGDDAGGMYPFPFQSASSGIGIYVKEKDREKAEQILNVSKK
ncbi:DUF2007 domain-containing protein [Candidatus Roizmanbacteria bacterium]|nr:DUF2007 domain-containing protein [Candidatus Roizmanbacteria bacterium]